MDIDAAKELQLIELSLNGDQKAFETLFVTYEPIVKQMLVNYTGSEFDANDLLQEAFIKAFLNLDKYDRKYTFVQWIRTIARNTFIDYARRKGVKSPMLLIDSVVMQKSVAENPENLIINAERRSEIEKEIASLSGNYKKVIELRYYLGYTYEEISEELGLPIGTVKNRLYRAKEMLNKILVKYRQA